MSGLPILTRIRQAMEQLIGTMTKDGGYNFDWGTVNQRNYSIGDFPRAEVYCSEENVDIKDGLSSRDYTNETLFEVRVACKLDKASKNPLFDIDFSFDLATDDLKAVFGLYNNVNGTCDEILYKGFKRTESAGSGDQFIPAKISVKFQVNYCQDRIHPEQYASS